MVHVSNKMNRRLVSRPKLGYGIPNEHLELPLYNGYQKENFYGVIDVMPDLLRELKDYVCVALNLPCSYFNHMLLSFCSDGHNGHIETHRDVAHSLEEQGQHEGSAYIVMLNLMEARTTVFTDPGGFHQPQAVAT